jgi:hypothetical protein
VMVVDVECSTGQGSTGVAASWTAAPETSKGQPRARALGDRAGVRVSHTVTKYGGAMKPVRGNGQSRILSAHVHEQL